MTTYFTSISRHKNSKFPIKRGHIMNFLGIDYGTTSVKAALFDEKLEQKLCLSEDYTLKVKDEIVEFEPLAYWDILKNIVEKVSQEFKTKKGKSK